MMQYDRRFYEYSHLKKKSVFQKTKKRINLNAKEKLAYAISISILLIALVFKFL